MKRRIIAAATLPAAGFTMFAAAFALTAQPASAAPDDTSGIANGARVQLPINAPVNVCGIAAGILGDATARCAVPRVAPTPGYGGEAPTRGRDGYGTPSQTPGTPGTPGGPGNETPPPATPTEYPTPPPTPTPTGSVPTAGQQEVPPTTPGQPEVPPTAGQQEVPPGGGVSNGSPEAPPSGGGVKGAEGGEGGEGGLPVTGLPLAGLVGAGALVTAGGAALLYSGRHRRRFQS